MARNEFGDWVDEERCADGEPSEGAWLRRVLAEWDLSQAVEDNFGAARLDPPNTRQLTSFVAAPIARAA